MRLKATTERAGWLSAATTTGAASPEVAATGGQSAVSRNVVLSAVAISALGVTRLVYNVLVGHGAGRATLGELNTCISIAMFATLLVSAGSSASAAKFIPANLTAVGADQSAWVRARLTLWTCIGTLATAVGVFFCTSFVVPGANLWLMLATAGLAATYGAYSFTKGVLYGYGQVRRYAALEIGVDVVVLVATAGLIVMRSPTVALLLPLLLGYGIFSAAGSVRSQRGAHGPARGAPRTALSREMAAFTVMNCVGALASTGFLQLSMVFARQYGSATQAGEYASALALTAPAYFLPRALTLALFPAMAGAYGRGDVDQIRRYADMATRLLLVGMLPFFVAAAILARPLLSVFFGPAFAAGQSVLQLLLLATFVSVVPVAATSSLTAAGPRLVKVPMIASVCGLLVGVALWAVLGPRLGVVAVAVGYLCGSVVQTVVPFAAAWRHYGQRWIGLATRATLLCLLAAALWFWARGAGHPVLAGAAATVGFGVVWAVACRAEIKLLAVPAVRAMRRHA